MSRRVSLRRAVVLVLAALLISACGPQSDTTAAADLRLYQVLPVPRPKSRFHNAPGEGEALALVNTGRRPLRIAGWQVAAGTGSIALPAITLQPAQVVYLANDAEYFKEYWNFAPQFEYGVNADPAVPDLPAGAQTPLVLHDTGDVVRLVNPAGDVVDVLAYGQAGRPPAPWSGPPVQLVNSFPLTPENQVITRVKDGSAYRKEARALAWTGGTEPLPGRVVYPGQTQFSVKTVTGAVTVTAAAAPDNAGPVLFDLVDGARQSIRLVGYQFNHKDLARRLVAAVQRGVKVQVALERNPSVGDLFDSDKEAQAVLHAGGVEILYYHKWDGDLSSRFNPLHAKYGIVDDAAVFVSSGNFIKSNYTADPTCGNREWMAVLRGNAEVVQGVQELFAADLMSGHAEVRPYIPALDRPLAPDTYDAGPCIPYTPVHPQPLTVSGQATVTRIVSPDNTLDTRDGFLSILRQAERQVLISAATITQWWGPENAAGSPEPQPYLQEILAAARRGVEVRVLLDRRNVRLASPRDNHRVVAYLNEAASRESLKLEARLVNMDGTGIGRTYHNKSLIVDDAVIISSINGTENSFRYARELAFKIAGLQPVTQYFRELFAHDWDASAAPNRPVNVQALPRNDGIFLRWSANAEPDVVKYEVHYRPDPGATWVQLAEVRDPGLGDSREQGTWGVMAVNRRGARSEMAEISR